MVLTSSQPENTNINTWQNWIPVYTLPRASVNLISSLHCTYELGKELPTEGKGWRPSTWKYAFRVRVSWRQKIRGAVKIESTLPLHSTKHGTLKTKQKATATLTCYERRNRRQNAFRSSQRKRNNTTPQSFQQSVSVSVQFRGKKLCVITGRSLKPSKRSYRKWWLYLEEGLNIFWWKTRKLKQVNTEVSPWRWLCWYIWQFWQEAGSFKIMQSRHPASSGFWQPLGRGLFQGYGRAIWVFVMQKDSIIPVSSPHWSERG